MVLAVLATAAVAAQGTQGPGLPAPTPAPLARAASPHPLPEGVVTPLTQPRPPAQKQKGRIKLAAPPTSTTTTTTPPPAPAVAAGPQIPAGKGMWIWKPELAERGDVIALVARARAVGLTHVFVRSGSTWDGLQNLQYLAQLLPYAHAAGLKVYGWDFPRLANPAEDVFRAKLAVNYVTASGDRLDGFAADIETLSEGTQFTAAAAQAYGDSLRAAVGRSTLLVAVVPNPTPQMRRQYSYDAVLPAFDAVAPMVYWLNRDPGQDTADALHFLSRYGLPLLPIGQAYDGGREGGRPGVPPPPEIWRFIQVSKQYGAVAVSFWSWQHANGPVWNAIKSAQDFSVPLVPKPKASS